MSSIKEIQAKTSSSVDKSMLRKFRLSNFMDNVISRGFSSLIVSLSVVIVLIILLAGIAYLIAAPSALTSPLEAFWTAFAYTTNSALLDPFYLDQPFAYDLITLLVVIAGLLVTSALVGIIATVLQRSYEGLRRGISPILDDGHIAIIGFNDSVQTFLSELSEAYSRRDPVSVVLIDDKLSREEMERRIESMTGLPIQKLKSQRGISIMCRNGNLRNIDDLKRYAVEKAMAVIINEHEDSLILKTLLAVASLLRGSNIDGDEAPIIVCTFREKQFAEAATHIGYERSLRVLALSDTLSNLIAKTCYQPGLSNILSELYSYEGAEFYLSSNESFVGMQFDEIITSFESAIPVGICRPSDDNPCGVDIILNTPRLNTGQSYEDVMRIQEDDKIVVVAFEKEAASKLLETNKQNKDQIHKIGWSDSLKSSSEHKKILVLGYDETLDKTILDLANYYNNPELSEHSSCYIKLIYRIKREPRVFESLERFMNDYSSSKMPIKELDISHGTTSDLKKINNLLIGKNTTVAFHCARSNYLNLPVLEDIFLAGESFDHVVVLSDLSMGRDEADTETLQTLLYLRAITENAANNVYGENVIPPFRITSEIQNMENINLAYNEHVSDYIISWKFIASLQMQVAGNRYMYKILRELLGPRGAEIQLEPVTRYINESDLMSVRYLDFDQIAEHLREYEDYSQRRIVIGYYRHKNGQHHFCPPRNKDGLRLVDLEPNDMLIVIRNC